MAVLGCGGSNGGDASAAVQLAFIPKTSNNLVFSMGNDGAQLSARDLTYARGVRVNTEYLASPQLDPTVEAGFIRQAIAAKKSGLLVSCLDDSLTAPINVALAAVITPTGDPFNLALMALPMIIFYEVGILLSRLVARQNAPAPGS